MGAAQYRLLTLTVDRFVVNSNSLIEILFPNRYLGASAFSNPPALFPGSYVGGSDLGKQQQQTEVLNGTSTQPPQPQGGVGEVAPRSSSPPPVNSSSSSTSSTRSTHPVDSATPKAKGNDRKGRRARR
ncbi:hypothetical protein CEXT_42171 [Caerostris extrusa]|uniref:Uncharacterized protein n=1 Tax=Caerostris extrusa TaxID=172846 RepID=A0AAV4PQF9_CAEEX|nr:hypothetical protein CEXT_42171 [Caerostris extrusa]